MTQNSVIVWFYLVLIRSDMASLLLCNVLIRMEEISISFIYYHQGRHEALQPGSFAKFVD